MFYEILAFYKNIPDEICFTRLGNWERLVGHEIYGKKIGVAGLGRIGKEILLRSKAFGLQLFAFDKYIDKSFINHYGVQVCDTLEELFSSVDIFKFWIMLNKLVSIRSFFLHRNIYS